MKWVITLGVSALLLVACSGDDDAPEPSPTIEPSATTEAVVPCPDGAGVVGGTGADNAGQRAETDCDPDLPGEFIPPHPGPDGQPGTGDERRHFNPGTVVPICTQQQIDAGTVSDPLCYTSNPPTSGPHSLTPQGFANMENPAPKENIVHSMEHGGVYIWYNTTDQGAIDLIKTLVDENNDQRRFVGSTVYTDMEPETIAITSWTRLDKFPVAQLTADRLEAFIDDHHKRFNPEGF